MRRVIPKFFATLTVLALLAAPATGVTRRLEVENTHPMWDAIFLRPLGATGLLFSTIFWVPVQGVTMIVRPTEWKKPIDMMLKDPYEFVFVDPLGSH